MDAWASLCYCYYLHPETEINRNYFHFLSKGFGYLKKPSEYVAAKYINRIKLQQWKRVELIQIQSEMALICVDQESLMKLTLEDQQISLI